MGYPDPSYKQGCFYWVDPVTPLGVLLQFGVASTRVRPIKQVYPTQTPGQHRQAQGRAARCLTKCMHKTKRTLVTQSHNVEGGMR